MVLTTSALVSLSSLLYGWRAPGRGEGGEREGASLMKLYTTQQTLEQNKGKEDGEQD
jgi:hypothetical protein